MERGLYKNRSNLHTTTVALVFIIVSMLTVHTQAVDNAVQVEPNTALLIEGQKTELLCRYSQPINYCRFEIPSENIMVLSQEWTSKTPGFSYFGSGLRSGECGVTIDRVSASHNGKVKCSLGVEGTEFSGIIDLVVALRPHQPVIEPLSKGDRDEAFAADTLFNARCIVRDGRPAANISWYIDETPIVQGLSTPDVIESPSDRNITLSTTVQQLQKYLTPEDDGKMLICRAHHQTDRDQPQEGKFLLKVRYTPVPQPDTTVYGLYLEHTAMVNVTIRANPTPITEWTIEGIAIPQGTQNGRYSSFEPINLGNGYYNVTLAIAGLTLEDTTKTYYLKASNAMGVRDYTVRISSSSTPPSSGLDIGSIVGIAVAVAVLVIVVLLIVFARATGRWCFGAKSKSPTSETHDETQQPGPNVALLESNNINSATPNGVTIVNNNNNNNNSSNTNGNGNGNGNQNNMNGRQRNSISLMVRGGGVGNDDDDSFEYATDRESSVYNPTTVPLKGVRSSTTSRQSTATTASDSLDQQQQPQQQQQQPTTAAGNGNGGADLLVRGNQLGIPESRCSRWIPKDQRELLESSDTESADIKTETKSSAAKSQRLPSFSSLFMRKNEKSKKDSTLAADQPGENDQSAGGEANRGMTAAGTGEDGVTAPGNSTTGNDGQPKEDKQLVYAELVLKPSDNQPMPSKNSTEYAEIVYVQKPTPGGPSSPPHSTTEAPDSKGKI